MHEKPWAHLQGQSQQVGYIAFVSLGIASFMTRAARTYIYLAVFTNQDEMDNTATT